MMNFMGSSRERGGGGGGFNYEEDPPRGGGTTRPFSPNSSSSQHHQKGHVVPLSSYHQHLLHQQQHDRWNIGGGVNCQLELMMDSSSSPTNFNTDSSSEDHNNLLIRPQQQGQGQGGGGEVVEREHMFDKVVTPSDVGKLNRLVIPKQYAEKYFPLDSSTNEKGLLLNFEDRNGKPWRFRYSYWNSSQSYVMTKGWSRFVKDKRLDAGDIVSFQRGLAELAKDLLFIDWRRRPDAPNHHLPPQIPHHLSFHPWNHPYYLQPSRDAASFLAHQSHLNSYATYSTGFGSVLYLRSAPATVAAGPQQMQFQRGSSTRDIIGGRVNHDEEPMVYESVTVVQGKAAAKRLRLFGVNMDCPISESDDQCDILSSTAVPIASNSSSVNPTLQLRPYSVDLLNKGKSSMSLDFDDISGMDKDPFCYFNNISAKED